MQHYYYYEGGSYPQFILQVGLQGRELSSASFLRRHHSKDKMKQASFYNFMASFKLQKIRSIFSSNLSYMIIQIITLF